MKNLSTLFLLLFFSFAAYSQTTDTLNKTDKQGKKQGVWIKKDDNGNMLYKGQFKDNYEVGEFVYYYPTGKVRNILQYSNKGANAQVKFYTEKETLLSEGFYKNKKKDSLWIIYSETGEKIAEERYKNNMKDGEWVIYDKGKVIESTMWNSNKRNGKYYKHFATGNYMNSTYKDNMLDGAFKEYDADNRLVSKGDYYQGEKNNIWEYYGSGSELVKQEKWNNGFLVYTKILIKTAESNLMLQTDSIAYFQVKGNGSEITTKTGTVIRSKNNIDELVSNIDLNTYQLLNLNLKFYARYTAIKEVKEDPETGRVLIKLQPESSFAVYADNEAEKGLRLHYIDGKK